LFELSGNAHVRHHVTTLKDESPGASAVAVGYYNCTVTMVTLTNKSWDGSAVVGYYNCTVTMVTLTNKSWDGSAVFFLCVKPKIFRSGMLVYESPTRAFS